MFSLWYLISLFKGKFKIVRDKEVLQWLESARQELTTLPTTSYLKDHLTQSIFKKIYKRQTEFGSTLKDVIKGGIVNKDWNIGFCAPDAESYFVFRELFESFVADYHCNMVHSESPDISLNLHMDPDWNKYVLNVCIECRRNISGFPFLPVISDQKLMELEESLEHIFAKFTGYLKGQYYSFLKMEKGDREKMKDYLFDNKDELMKILGVYREWPLGRGVFINEHENLTIKVNESDHLKIICCREDADLDELYRIYRNAVSAIEDRIETAFDFKLGYLTLLPSTIGTAMQITIKTRLSNLTEERINEICSERDLGMNFNEDICEVFNIRSLGLSEYECALNVKECIEELIREERCCGTESLPGSSGDYEF